MSQKKTIKFTATIILDDDCPYTDDGFIVPAVREAFQAMTVKGLFDQSFSPSPHLSFEPTNDGRISRFSDSDMITGKPLEASDLTGFTGLVDGKYRIQVDISATSEADR